MNALHPLGAVSKAGACAPVLVGQKDSGQCCTACARQGRTCCQGHDIYVTHGDCERIQRLSGAAGFFEYRGCSHAAYADQDDDPVWRQHVFRSDGSRRVIKWLAGGDCFFLEPTGCTLPLTARPLVCRLYPHLYSDKGIEGVWDSECRIARMQANQLIEQGIAGIQWQEALKWHDMLYREILWEADTNENRFDL